MIVRVIALVVTGASIGLGATFIYFACGCSWFDEYLWFVWW